jgi:dipeptidyl-peptidase 4
MKYLGSIIMVLMVFQTAFAQDLSLSLDDIYGPESKIKFSGEDLPRLKWDSSGNNLIKSSDFENGLVEKLDLSSGALINLVDRDLFLQSFIDLPGFGGQDAVKKILKDAKYILSPGEDKILVQCSEDLFLFSENILVRLTRNSAKEKVITFSPSGSQLAFVREGDLYLVDLDTQKERRLTEKPDNNTLNGYLDWVYQEEVYGRGDFKAYWWSPDSRYIAFLQLDISEEPVHTILDNCKINPDEEKQAYPYPGDPLAKVKLGIISVRDNRIKWMDFSRYSGKDYLVVSVDWAPGSDRVYAQVQNRAQTWLELAAYDPAGGKEYQLIRETSPAWVDRLEKPFWLTDGSFLWQSNRSGFRHIYHYSSDGELVGEITNGNIDVRALHAVSEEQGTVFFSAARDDFKDLHVYSVNLDGSGFKKVTDLPGQHRARFNKKGTMFIDTWSDIDTPSRVFLNRADGSTLRTLVENRVEVLDQYRLSKPEFVQVEARDGFLMEAMIIKPPDFDESEKYPVLMYTYGGPGSQSVLNRWGGSTYMWHQFLAQQGYIIWVFDDRIASGKGVKSAWAGYKNLGPVAIKDIEDGLDWLSGNPWVDKDRIGIWGWSYGGYATAFALTHSKYFKIGIAGAPVTDWRQYDSIYTERYMAEPLDNPEGYKNTSVIESSGDLHGRLLLIHGAVDDNVHTLNSIRLAEKLQKAGIQFEYMVYPGARHGVKDLHQVRQMRELMTLFIQENL